MFCAGRAQAKHVAEKALSEDRSLNIKADTHRSDSEGVIICYLAHIWYPTWNPGKWKHGLKTAVPLVGPIPLFLPFARIFQRQARQVRRIARTKRHGSLVPHPASMALPTPIKRKPTETLGILGGILDRSFSREDRIRPPYFFSVVYFSGGTLPQKRNGKRTLLGDLA